MAAGACSEIGSDPSVAVALSFDSLPAPAIVAYDFLRDSAGAKVKFSAHAFNAKGVEIANAPIRFFTADSPFVWVDSGGYAKSDSFRLTPAKIIAEINGLQIKRSLDIIRSPDSLARVTDTVSIAYVLPDTSLATADLNTSVPLKVTVLHRDSAGFTSPVRSVVVHYAISYPAAAATTGTAADTTRVAFLISDATRARSSVDTTDGSGSSGRRVRLRPALLTTTQDSVVVTASVTYQGAPLSGSPVRLVVRVAPIP